MRYRIRTLALLLLSLFLLPATGCSVAPKMSPEGKRMAEAGKQELAKMKAIADEIIRDTEAIAARPALTDDLIAEAWRENARRDSVRLAQMEAQSKATAQSFSDQISLVQRNAAALVENTHPLTVFGGEAQKPAAGSGTAGVGLKVDKVLGTLSGQGQQVQQTLQRAEAVARQVQELVVLAQEIRAAQQAIAGQQPDTLVQQGPAGILGLISLILAFLLRQAHKQNPPPKP